MNFIEFHNHIHKRDFLIVCLNDYKLEGEYHTFIAVQDKQGHGFHAEGKSDNLSQIYKEIIAKIENQ
ncbi:MAG: hypothetical protein COT24_03160 [Candidatus Kerfeldbacteria bacterium CG08_land_8_20_14_0_20_40_16]|uniref:Uncharacterized protein n=1 Tax=Candidatus Kerfeldbacteria bacterium CG08_land_8_20_14_0_20_40_16 TaxID=2014244 RepID=A0A2H0YVP1_9BACT|nr:MAG: hypothetical protein COT24_03160 [Candidatus Kerfeldbacteria bacterium CG08_land_8_20_14_0_20_40_16]